MQQDSEIVQRRSLVKDTNAQILFTNKAVRLFSYGCLSVPLLLFLAQIGLQGKEIGFLLTAIMIGDLILTMLLTIKSNKLGRKRVLVIGSFLQICTGIAFSYSSNFWILMISGIFGVISLSGSDVGPFQAIQQSILTDLVETNVQESGEQNMDGKVAEVFGWYNMVGYSAQAIGAMAAGLAIKGLKNYGFSSVEAHRAIIISYAFFGLVKLVIYSFLTEQVELHHQHEEQSTQWWKLGIKDPQIYKTVIFISILFGLDAFGGGFLVNSFISFWYVKQWNFEESTIGTVLMACGFMSAWGGILASYLVKYIGSLSTILVTHIPSNILTLIIPFISNPVLSVIILILRFFTSKMNVSARQTYLNTLVKSSQRSAANGITSITRSLGVAFSPLILGPLLNAKKNSTQANLPFYLGGGSKLFYNLLLLAFVLLYKTKSPNKEEKQVNQQTFQGQI